MKCINPRRLPNPSPRNPPFDTFILSSCGKCYACLANRRRSWLFRLQNELLDSPLTLFATLTYDDNSRPYDHCVNKEHVQKFFKRLRHDCSFKYYAIGEYGTRTHREHYHVVFFIKSGSFRYMDDVIDLIDRYWFYGNVQVSRCTYRRLNYILHYHTRPKEVDGRKTFQLFSKGLGVGFINHDLLRYLVDTGNSVIHDYNGNVYVIPRYYRKKLKDMFISSSQGVLSIPDKDFLDYSRSVDDRCLKVFGKHVWEISEAQYLSYYNDIVSKDSQKIKRYNLQDKYD